MRVLITGSNRGLGLEFVRQLAARGDRIFAACRRPQEAPALRELQVRCSGQITLIQLDTADEVSIASAYEAVRSQTEAIDMLINNAGIFKEDDPLGQLDQATMLRFFSVNAIGPILIIQRFLDLLKTGDQSRIINITSGLGSLAWRNEGGKYSYAASKAALNMINRTLAYDLRNTTIIPIVIDPGWVQTDMGGPNAWITPAQSVGDMLSVIDRLTPEHAGLFFHHSGEQVPW